MTRMTKNNVHFGCRTAGVILHNGYILLQGEPDGTFWTLPGGGIELLENSHEALKREMQEELGIDIHVERLLWIVEHLFLSDSDRKVCHEIGFYYLVAPLNTPNLYNLERIFHAKDGETAIIFQWFKLTGLSNVLLYPLFLQAELKALPVVPKHILCDEMHAPPL